MSEIAENCSKIDAQSALKSSLGGTLGFNLSSFGTGSRKMDTRYWNGNEKMDTGSWKMETGSHQMYHPDEYPGVRVHEGRLHPRLAREAPGGRCSNILIDKRAGPPAASESAFRNSSSQKSMKAHNTMFVVNPYKYVYFLGGFTTN